MVCKLVTLIPGHTTQNRIVLTFQIDCSLSGTIERTHNACMFRGATNGRIPEIEERDDDDDGRR